MKLFASLALISVVNLAWHVRPAPTAVLDPIEVTPGTPLAPELVASLDAGCTMLVFFDPGCPFCERLAEAHRERGGTPLTTRWVTNDPLAGGRFGYLLPDDAGILISRDLFKELRVQAVPAAAWIRDGKVVATSSLRGTESDEALLAPCVDDAPDAAIAAQ